MSDQPRQWVSVSSGDLTAEIDPLGAQLSTLRDHAGRDLLWDGDPSIWAGRAPILFPIVGALAGGTYRLGPDTYRLGRHGFARSCLFDVTASASASATFTLRATEATLRLYPFHFELNVHFAVHGPTLSVTTSVQNTGGEDMPASFGYHPAFRWPLPFGKLRAAHAIEFESEEHAPIRRLNAAGLMLPEPRATPVARRRLPLTDALFQDDVIIFDALHSRFVTYGSEGAPRIRVGFPDAPYLGIWTKPAANFICIEPWHGVADAAGFSGDFRTKTGVFVVRAGAVMPIRMALTLLDG